MKHLKTLALAAVAACALMAFTGAGPASATVLCYTKLEVELCPPAERWPAGTILHFSLTSGVSSTWRETNEPEGEGEVLETCNASTLQVKTENSGGAIETVKAPIIEWTLKTCAWPASITPKGSFEIHKIVGTANGTITANQEIRMTIDPHFFGSCVYALSGGESLGDITEGKPAIFHVNAVVHRVEGFSVFCPTTVVWTATYTLTSPEKTTLAVAIE